MLHDEWSLDGIGAGITGGRIGRHIHLIERITAGNGLRLGTSPHASSSCLKGISWIHPERAPGKPGLSLLIDHKIRINGIPILSPPFEDMSSPHPSIHQVSASEELLSNPMAEVFLPKVEQE